MIKRTLYFGNPTYLSTKDEQLIIKLVLTGEIKQTPIEDIGVVMLDNQQITITHSVLAKLLDNNVALITCDDTHHPVGMMQCLDGNSIQSQRFKYQIESKLPLKKQLWQQTIKAKISNQAKALQMIGINNDKLAQLENKVKSGDPTNEEGKASRIYWKNYLPGFKRDRFGDAPNNFLNYGYAILRATIARSIVGAGLLPTLGIFHRNQYNAYCLADDLMEPYRPFVDLLVYQYYQEHPNESILSIKSKKHLLQIPVLDVWMEKQWSPLMIATQHTTASLAQCFEGFRKTIKYPQLK